jgi:predicted nucleotidyltransferase component of viral defense system
MDERDTMIGKMTDILSRREGVLDKRILHEVLQQVALAGLYRAGFFEKAAFYGGTCLRIFHGLDRFSEDMDFSLLTWEKDFDLSVYFGAVRDEFSAYGCDVEIVKKQKSADSTIESAFLKSDTEIYRLIPQNRGNIKIKIEVDKKPPPGFATEPKLSLLPFSFMTPCFALPDLFAGKMHAVMFRKWKTRVKGRDWYDFEWYVRNGVPLNLTHFNERALQSETGMKEGFSRESFAEALRERIKNLDIKKASDDVRPFLRDPEGLKIWSRDYFVEVASMIRFT